MQTETHKKSRSSEGFKTGITWKGTKGTTLKQIILDRKEYIKYVNRRQTIHQKQGDS